MMKKKWIIFILFYKKILAYYKLKRFIYNKLIMTLKNILLYILFTLSFVMILKIFYKSNKFSNKRGVMEVENESSSQMAAIDHSRND